MQQRGQIAVRGPLKRVERRHRRLVRRPDGVTRYVGPEGAFAAFPRPAQVPVVGEIGKACFPPVRIRRFEPIGAPHVVTELSHGDGVQVQRIALRRGRVGDRRQLVDARQRFGQRARAVEWIPPPRRVEIAPLGQLAAGAPQPLDRALGAVAAVARPDAPAERTADAFGWMFELFAEPAIERLLEQRVGLRLGQDHEERIDAGFDRTLAEQISAETVDRADVRFFEPLDRVGKIRPHAFVFRPMAPLLQLLTQTQLQLARRLFGEGDGDDLIDPCAAAGEHLEHALDQLGRLPRSGRRFDDDRIVETCADQIAIRLVAQRRHGFLRSASRSASGSCALFLPIRRSTFGPQTGRKSHQAHAFSAGAGARNPVSIARSTISSTSTPRRRAIGVSGIRASLKPPSVVA